MENQLESGEVLGSGFSDFSQPHLPKMYEKPWQLCWLLGITRGLLEVFYPHNILPKETVVACPRFLNSFGKLWAYSDPAGCTGVCDIPLTP